jgi:acyl-[acyl-carrier-protein]-phospholipid O-acyltransferase / long-chain-fatty-acid--[acyl-carrier-protein] ligase
MSTFLYVLLAVLGVVVAATLFAIFNRRAFVRCLFRPTLFLLYRARVVGLENFPREGGVVVLSNHVSWIDGILLLWLLPRNIRFVVDGGNFHSRVADFLAGAFDTIMMSSSPKSVGRALQTARAGLNSGEVIGIFPEGTLTRTGHLQAFKPGITKIVKGTDAKLVPVYLDGMWGSIFSFSGGKFFFKWPSCPRRELTLYIDKPMPVDTPVDILQSHVLRLGAQATIEHRNQFALLPKEIIRVWRQDGSHKKVVDSTGVELTGRDALIRTLALRRMLRREVLKDDEQTVGLLLPPSVAGVVSNVAMAMDRRVTANLNYTLSSSAVNYCIEQAGIRTVLTSAKFLEKIDMKLSANVVPLESLKDKVNKLDKAFAFIQAVLLPAPLLHLVLGLNRIQPDDLLTVIFTSGSTGNPKGVMLSHANISHNVEAIRRAVRLTREDVVLGVLPFFHSFGYSVTLWGVMTLGPMGVYHFNPLDARQVGKLAERYGATVLLGTPTFLRGYLRRIEPEQFAKLSVVVVGAEKMPADLFEAFEKRFGVRPVEGYGATELSPLVSVNIPPSRSQAKFQLDRIEGSVGRPLPGIATRIVSPDDDSIHLGAGQDGMLLVTGPNVMKGYLGREDLTQNAVRDGWYVTGDIAHMDDQGFLHITGRLSRFSKIGGEMVPHIRIEEELMKCIGDDPEDEKIQLCVTSVPDPKRGERLVVLHLPTSKSIDEMRASLTSAGLPNLFVPSNDSFFVVESIPILGTGKLDLKQAKDVALELTSKTTSQAEDE